MTAARAVALALLLLVAASSARAATPPTVSLVVEGCPALDEARLRALVAIELSSIASAPTSARYEARLACAGDVVSIDLRRDAPSVALDAAAHTEVDLGSTAEATRLRVLALAITEQVALERNAASRAPATSPPRGESPTLLTSAPAPVPEARARWRVFARASARRAAQPSLWLAGAGVGAELGLSRAFGVAPDLDAEGGDAATSLATVAVRDLRLTAGVAVGGEAGRWSWRAVPGFSVARAHLAATPHDVAARGATLDATWAGPSLALRAQGALSRHAFLLAEAAGALTTRAVTGLVDGQSTLFALRGPSVSFGLGVGATF